MTTVKEKQATNHEQSNLRDSTSEEVGQVTTVPINNDPLAGDENRGGVNYKSCKWYNVGFLMIAECISLGILSLPHTMATLGLAR
jgi:hypothetical protein